ncbi:zinc finger protein 638-like [Salarias fasciatus]|uniref:zinc finger protein 638-like n=1 Tax=Salarias fasciatus TaxID=181472 RepID=UPI0011769B51|nr:zinc finger protein 638-like [Salarias fasciatus]
MNLVLLCNSLSLLSTSAWLFADSNSHVTPTFSLTLSSSLSIARGTHFIFGSVAGAAAVTALRLAHIGNQALIALRQLATLVTLVVGGQRPGGGLTAASTPRPALLSLLNKQRGSTVGSYRIMYHQHSQQQGQQPFPGGPRPHQPPPSHAPGHAPGHPSMQRMGFPFPRPTQLPDELESALSARGVRDMDHRQMDHMNRPNQHQNQGPPPRMNQQGSYGSGAMPLPADNPPAHQQGVDWSNFQPPAKLFAGPPPSVGLQSQQHHGPLQQPPNIQAGLPVQNWPPPMSDSPLAQTRHPHAGGEGQNLYTPESAGSILASFGLSNEDLEVLSHYPDDQLTPDTLPFILRDIQINKSSNQNPAASSSAPMFSRSIHDMPLRPSSSSPLVSPEVPSFLTVTQTAGKVIDYGHASRVKDGGQTFKREPLSSERTVKMYPASSSRSSAPKAEKTERRQLRLEASGPAKRGDRDYRRSSGDPRQSAEFRTSPKSRHQDRDYRCDRTKARPPSESRSEASSRRSLSSSSGSKPRRGSTKLPSPTMISDFSAESPKVYPHTCSLCSIQCDQEQDWLEHVNTVSHTASCRDLRNQYPNWRPDAPSRGRQHGSRAPWDPRERALSFSRSPSPGDGRVYRPRVRPGSPHRHPRQYLYPERRHHTQRRSRSRSRSRSPPAVHRSSSRERWLQRTRLSAVGLSHGGLKRPHEDWSPSARSSKHPPTKSSKAGTKSGTKTAVKGPPAKKKKVVPPAPEDPLVSDRLVFLTGIPEDASEQEVTDLVCSFGKINNVMLIPSCEEESQEAPGQKASVCMLKAEDARALCACSALSIRDQTITASAAQKPEAEQPSDADSRNPEADDGAPGSQSVKADEKTAMKSTVLVSGLPDGGCSQSDVLALFPGLERGCDVLLVPPLGKAVVAVSDVERVQEMINNHSVTPARVKDSEVKLVLIQQNVGLSTPVGLYNLLMGAAHPADSPVRVGWSRLLVIRNVPDSPAGSSQVLTLVRRFGTVIKSLVLSGMVICEMATAATALSVYKRFRSFPCIIHRNPLSFSRKPDPKPTKQPKVAAASQQPPQDTPAHSQPAAAAEEDMPPEEPPPDALQNVRGLSEKEPSTEGVAEDEAPGGVVDKDGGGGAGSAGPEASEGGGAAAEGGGAAAEGGGTAAEGGVTAAEGGKVEEPPQRAGEQPQRAGEQPQRAEEQPQRAG